MKYSKFVAWLLFYSLSLGALAQTDSQIEIAQTIKPVLEKISNSLLPAERLMRYTVRKVIKGRFLPDIPVTESHNVRLATNGVYVDAMQEKGEKFLTTSTVFTACGVFELALTSGSTTQVRQTIAFPIGKILVPLVAGASQYSAINKLIDASGEVEQACFPQAGMALKYQWTVTARGVQKSFFTTQSETTNVYSADCTVGTALAASLLNQKLRGEYLPIACDVQKDGSEASKNNYAFLINDRYQILLSSSGDRLSSFSEIIDAEYGRVDER